MANPKDIVVTTTSTVEGIVIKEYLRPVSAHIVAGTNLFNDFFASFSDVFGGRSQAYQKQLVSLYNEAIDRIRNAAYELGATGVVGLSIDMDEISGKGKSMFMLTAVGTAVVFDKNLKQTPTTTYLAEKYENVPAEKISNLQTKKKIIQEASSDKLSLTPDVWTFITLNQVSEIFPYLLQKYSNSLVYLQNHPEDSNKFQELLLAFIDNLPELEKKRLLYKSIGLVTDKLLVSGLLEIMESLHLFDMELTKELLEETEFRKQKVGLHTLLFDKPFYDKQDIEKYNEIIQYIENTFGPRGIISSKKQLLSSKEKEVWKCECGRENNTIGDICNACYKDIDGFLRDEASPSKVVSVLKNKVELISECVLN